MNRLRTGQRAVAILMLVSVLGSPWAAGQINQVGRDLLPSLRYPPVFRQYFRGDYNDALGDFRQLARLAYQDANGYYLDSVCYGVMQGECFYQLGNYVSAVELYEQSLKLYIDLIQWDSRTQFPAQINSDNNAWQRARITWGVPARQTVIANLPDSFQVLFGQLDNTRVLVEGGVVQNPNFRSVNLSEILRCAAIGLYRRNKIKGSLCVHDPFTSQLIAALTTKTDGSGRLPAVWNAVLLGLAQWSAGKNSEAYTTLQSSLQYNQSMDHQLTPIALLALGEILLAEGKVEEAQTIFMEASYSAAVFAQYDLVGESLAEANVCFLMRRPQQAFAPLATAMQWSNRENADALTARLMIEASKGLAEISDFDSALTMLGQAKRVFSGSDLARTSLGMDFQYLSAMIDFSQGRFNQGLSSLADAVKFWRQFSSRMYQIKLADQLINRRALSPRQADLVYAELLRDPTEQDWLRDPLEPMGFMLTDHIDSMQLWFDALMIERRMDSALAVADQLRRHRYYATQPLGGRLLSLRWLLESPESRLTESALSQRRAILGRYPQYATASTSLNNAVQQLGQLPLVSQEGSAEEKQQRDLVEQIDELAQSLETMIAMISLRREPADLAFARRVPVTGSESLIPPKTAIISTIATEQGVHIFTVIDGVVNLETTVNRRQMAKAVSALLQSIGNTNDKNPIELSEYPTEKWRPEVDAAYQLLFPNRKQAFWHQVGEIIVIPDDSLWYLPWQLTLSDPENASPLRLRCCPMLSVALPSEMPRAQFPKTVLAIGKESDVRIQQVIDRQSADFKRAVPEIQEVRETGKLATSVLAAVIDRLIVWTPMTKVDVRTLGNQSVLQTESSRAPGTWDQWLELPIQAPREMVMPALTSVAANGARSGDGSELFLLACDLMAMGTDTALISRWYTGTVASCQASEEFTQSLTQQSAIDGWNAAQAEIRQLPVDYGEGSRIRKPKVAVEGLKSDHPFFWAGYLLIDTGWKPLPPPADESNN